MDETRNFDIDIIEEENIYETLKEVCVVLEERGYNPVNQIVGYLMSGDPGYISSHKEARSKITEFERNKILEMLVEGFLNQ